MAFEWRASISLFVRCEKFKINFRMLLVRAFAWRALPVGRIEIQQSLFLAAIGIDGARRTVADEPRRSEVRIGIVGDDIEEIELVFLFDLNIARQTKISNAQAGF